MLENALVRRNCSLRVKITVKTLVSAGIVVLAVLLPQLVHLAAGQAGGVREVASGNLGYRIYEIFR